MAHRFTGRRTLGVALSRIQQNTQAEVQRALQRGALSIQNRAVEGIISPPKTGRKYRKYRPPRIHQASAPGEFPAADTGRLHQSITSAVVVSPTSFQIEVASNVEYGAYLELGTSKMEPRPFLAPAWAENIHRIRQDVRTAIRRGSRGRGIRGILNLIFGR